MTTNELCTLLASGKPIGPALDLLTDLLRSVEVVCENPDNDAEEFGPIYRSYQRLLAAKPSVGST